MISRLQMVAFFVAVATVVWGGCRSVQQRASADASWVGQRQNGDDQTAVVQTEYSPDETNAQHSHVQVTEYLTDREATSTESPPMPRNPKPPIPMPIRNQGTSVASDGHPSLIGGTQLGGPQVTATEHALRLKQENARMKKAGKQLLADNRYQQAELSRQELLMDRMAAAMSAAQRKLTSADQDNQDLKRQISALQLETQQQQLRTDRMLTTIRDELDDALVREIAVRN